jgi:hypothetical protein
MKVDKTQTDSWAEKKPRQTENKTQEAALKTMQYGAIILYQAKLQLT